MTETDRQGKVGGIKSSLEPRGGANETLRDKKSSRTGKGNRVAKPTSRTLVPDWLEAEAAYRPNHQGRNFDHTLRKGGVLGGKRNSPDPEGGGE